MLTQVKVNNIVTNKFKYCVDDNICINNEDNFKFY